MGQIDQKADLNELQIHKSMFMLSERCSSKVRNKNNNYDHDFLIEYYIYHCEQNYNVLNKL